MREIQALNLERNLVSRAAPHDYGLNYGKGFSLFKARHDTNYKRTFAVTLVLAVVEQGLKILHAENIHSCLI